MHWETHSIEPTCLDMDKQIFLADWAELWLIQLQRESVNLFDQLKKFVSPKLTSLAVNGLTDATEWILCVLFLGFFWFWNIS